MFCRLRAPLTCINPDASATDADSRLASQRELIVAGGAITRPRPCVARTASGVAVSVRGSSTPAAA